MSGNSLKLWNGSKYCRSNKYHPITYSVWKKIQSNEICQSFCFSVRYMKLSAVQFLITRGADPNLVNHRGETAISIAKSLPAEQRQNFLNVLLGIFDLNRIIIMMTILGTSIDVQSNKAGKNFSIE